MATDPQEITQARQALRDGQSSQERTVIALEQIADTLESMRSEIVSLQQAMLASVRSVAFR
jgi:flagellin-like hook-associated protein FlgL